MANLLKLLDVKKNEILQGHIDSSLGKGRYSVLFNGFPVVAESVSSQIFQSGDVVLITEVSGNYRILGSSGSMNTGRKIVFIKG